jgi:hypothetical protein
VEPGKSALGGDDEEISWNIDMFWKSNWLLKPHGPKKRQSIADLAPVQWSSTRSHPACYAAFEFQCQMSYFPASP